MGSNPTLPADPQASPVPLAIKPDHERPTSDLAWAAGLFDAEGSVYVWRQRSRRPGEWRLQRGMEISQGGDGSVPEVLVRLREILGRGRFRGPSRGYLYYWYSARQSDIDAISARLWPWLAVQKREQFRIAAQAVQRSVPAATQLGGAWTDEIAWAAGFFEGEGTIRAHRGHAELALPQATRDGLVPDSLTRFRRAIGDLGWIIGPIEPSSAWSKLPQFVWGSARFEHVQAVVAMLWPHLSKRRREEAHRALHAPGRRDSA